MGTFRLKGDSIAHLKRGVLRVAGLAESLLHVEDGLHVQERELVGAVEQ